MSSDSLADDDGPAVDIVVRRRRPAVRPTMRVSPSDDTDDDGPAIVVRRRQQTVRQQRRHHHSSCLVQCYLQNVDVEFLLPVICRTFHINTTNYTFAKFCILYSTFCIHNTPSRRRNMLKKHPLLVHVSSALSISGILKKAGYIIYRTMEHDVFCLFIC